MEKKEPGIFNREELSGVAKLASQAAVIIAGIGNTLKGDDAFGPLLISRLQGKVRAMLFDCGQAPENYIRPIVNARPQAVFIADAADWGAPAGEIRLVKIEEISDCGFSTHNSSLRIFCEYLKHELPGVKIVIIGVQAKSRGFMQPLSLEVEQALERLVELFSAG